MPRKQPVRKSRKAEPEQELPIRTLLDATPQSVLGVNAGGKIVLINDNTEKLFGYSRAELVGQPLDMLVPESARGHHAGHHEAYFSSGMPSRPMGIGLELEGRRKDGSTFPVEIG